MDESVWSDTLCHLSDIAIRLNRKVVWDPKKERFIGDEEANLRLRPAPECARRWHCIAKPPPSPRLCRLDDLDLRVAGMDLLRKPVA